MNEHLSRPAFLLRNAHQGVERPLRQPMNLVLMTYSLLFLTMTFFFSVFDRIKQDEKARLAELETSVKEKDMKSQLILDEKKNATMAVSITSRNFFLFSSVTTNRPAVPMDKDSFNGICLNSELRRFNLRLTLLFACHCQPFCISLIDKHCFYHVDFQLKTTI